MESDKNIENQIPLGGEIEFDVKPDGEESINMPWNPNDSRVDTRTVTIDLIIKRLKEKEIDLNPDFQRHGGIWSEQQKSSLIESILIKIPLPMFYFDASNEDMWIVIDGLQRLTAFREYFLEGSRLKRLQYLSQFDNYTYEELPRHLRRRIEETQITVNLIQPGTPEKVKFDIFRRINTGGLILSAQEIRNALNQGPVIELMNILANSEEFKAATSGSVSSDRMNDQDFVLRFLAFMINGYDAYDNPDIDAFLNTSMAQLNKRPDIYDNLEKKFKESMHISYELFGNLAFRKIYLNDSSRKPLNKALFEAWSVNLANLSLYEVENLVERKADLLQRFIQELDNDKEFEKSISYGTQDIKKTKKRFQKVRNIIEATIYDK